MAKLHPMIKAVSSSEHATTTIVANARLIAAAPDLLQACKRVMQLSVSAGSDEIFAEVRAAIEKAEGR